jgi:ATP-dependent DNA helicase PIF1
MNVIEIPRSNSREPFLSKVIESVLKKQNVILHGPGGTGKSYTIAALVKALRDKTIYVTAPTGAAAVNITQEGIKASTIHRWSGIGFQGDKPAEDLAKIVGDNLWSRNTWLRCEVLVVDEVSMLGARLFEKLDYIGRQIRKIDAVFGGITLVFSGDFFQIPPVKDEFVFLSQVWKDMFLDWFELTCPRRYEDEDWFYALARFRIGTHTSEDIEFMEKRMKAYERFLETSDLLTIHPTKLYSKNIDVDSYNNTKLKELPGDARAFVWSINYKPKPKRSIKQEFVKDTFLKMIPEIIHLKVGAQVMLKRNLDIDQGLANGSRGVVMELSELGAKVLFKNGVIQLISNVTWEHEDSDGLSVCTQIPLILAWAITIHKSQGSSLDFCCVDMGPSVFESGQAYVAMSRVRTSRGLFVSNISKNSFKVNTQVLGYLESVLGDSLKLQGRPQTDFDGHDCLRPAIAIPIFIDSDDVKIREIGFFDSRLRITNTFIKSQELKDFLGGDGEAPRKLSDRQLVKLTRLLEGKALKFLRGDLSPEATLGEETKSLSTPKMIPSKVKFETQRLYVNLGEDFSIANSTLDSRVKNLDIEVPQGGAFMIVDGKFFPTQKETTAMIGPLIVFEMNE